MSSKAAPYEPREDTILLANILDHTSGEWGLEIGVGGGLVLELLCARVRLAVGTDLDPAALEVTNRRLRATGRRAELVRCDGASPFRARTFDIVAVNPPYLVSEGLGDHTIEGGVTGSEKAIRLACDGARTLKADGTLFFVLSSLSAFERVIRALDAAGFQVTLLQRNRLFYEELMLFRAQPRH